MVTGTALAGKIQVGESLWVTGADKQVRVRGIHRQNQISEFAVAGDRVALNLVGDIDKENITRGIGYLQSNLRLLQHGLLLNWNAMH